MDVPEPNGGPQIRVLLADDHAATRRHVREFLEQADGFEVIGEAADGAAAVQLTERLQPDILLLDLHMPTMSSLQAVQALHGRSLPTQTVIFTGFDLEPYAATLMQHGVSWYLSKATFARDIVSALRMVHAGQQDLQVPNERVLETTSESGPRGRPSASELAVLHLLAEGRRNAEIASRLCISERVVQFRLGQLLSRLQATSRSEIVQRAHDQGWLR